MCLKITALFLLKILGLEISGVCLYEQAFKKQGRNAALFSMLRSFFAHQLLGHSSLFDLDNGHCPLLPIQFVPNDRKRSNKLMTKPASV